MSLCIHRVCKQVEELQRRQTRTLWTHWSMTVQTQARKIPKYLARAVIFCLSLSQGIWEKKQVHQKELMNLIWETRAEATGRHKSRYLDLRVAACPSSFNVCNFFIHFDCWWHFSSIYFMTLILINNKNNLPYSCAVFFSSQLILCQRLNVPHNHCYQSSLQITSHNSL